MVRRRRLILNATLNYPCGILSTCEPIVKAPATQHVRAECVLREKLRNQLAKLLRVGRIAIGGHRAQQGTEVDQICLVVSVAANFRAAILAMQMMFVIARTPYLRRASRVSVVFASANTARTSNACERAVRTSAAHLVPGHL